MNRVPVAGPAAARGRASPGRAPGLTAAQGLQLDDGGHVVGRLPPERRPPDPSSFPALDSSDSKLSRASVRRRNWDPHCEPGQDLPPAAVRRPLGLPPGTVPRPPMEPRRRDVGVSIREMDPTELWGGRRARARPAGSSAEVLRTGTDVCTVGIRASRSGFPRLARRCRAARGGVGRAASKGVERSRRVDGGRVRAEAGLMPPGSPRMCRLGDRADRDVGREPSVPSGRCPVGAPSVPVLPCIPGAFPRSPRSWPRSCYRNVRG